MKNMRKSAFACAICLSITVCPTSISAAASDNVAAQIAAASGEMYSVNTKALGFTAWQDPPPQDERDPTSKEEYEQSWKENVAELIEQGVYYYNVSVLPNTQIATVRERFNHPSGVDPGRLLLTDVNGKQILKTTLGDRGENLTISNDIVSKTRGLYCKHEVSYESYEIQSEWGDYTATRPILAEAGAEYIGLGDNSKIGYVTGTPMINNVAAVLEDISNGNTKVGSKEEYVGNGAHRLSLINEKGEKYFSLDEPIELINNSAGGCDNYYNGYNYTMNFGSYSDGLLPFTCDRQIGNTLNDFTLNTGADKDEETNDFMMLKSKKYIFAEHEAGYADLNGNVVIPQKFDTVSAFSEGLAWVGIITDNSDVLNPVYQYGFIDKSGEYVIEPQFENVGSFSEGLAPAKKDGKWGYIDKTGKFVIEPQYGEWYSGMWNDRNIGASGFSDGIAQVAVKDGDEPAKWGYINSKGETILPLEYDDAFGTDGTYFSVGKTVDGAVKYGVVDQDGDTVLPFIFEDITAPVDGTVYAFYNRELYSFMISPATSEPKENTNKSVILSDADGNKYDLPLNLDSYAQNAYAMNYYTDLSYTLSILADSAYKANIATENYKALGFEEERILSMNYSGDYLFRNAAYTIAKKQLPNSDDLILITIKGSSNTSDWITDFDIVTQELYGNGKHKGFSKTCEKVYDSLVTYLGGSLQKEHTIYMVTGHSMGAGVANLLEKKLVDKGVPKNCVYGYNFACPDTGMDYPTNWNSKGKYDNIFNIAVLGDIVPLVPGLIGDAGAARSRFIPSGWGTTWGKYGRSRWFCLDWNDATYDDFKLITKVMKHHDCGNYINHMSKKKLWNDAKTWEALVLEYGKKGAQYAEEKISSVFDQLSEWISVSIFCPVDVQIMNSDGKCIASIVDNKVIETESDNNLVIAWTEDDAKHICVIGTNDVSIKMLGTDTGTMDCYFVRKSSDGNMTESYAGFEAIDLVKEKQMVFNSSKETNIIQVLDSNEKVIEEIPPTQETPAYYYGDADLNNEVSVEDAQLALNSYVKSMAGMESILSEQQERITDINGDEEVSVEDAQLILLYYVKNTVSGNPTTWGELLTKNTSATT